MDAIEFKITSRLLRLFWQIYTRSIWPQFLWINAS